MAHLSYFSYPGFGDDNRETGAMAARVPAGETITISGQGGWDRATSKVHSDLADEISQAFDNVDHTLSHAGASGITSTYKLVVYYAPFSEHALELTIENIKKRFPAHRPTITAIGVQELALPGMRIEIEAWAHLASTA